MMQLFTYDLKYQIGSTPRWLAGGIPSRICLANSGEPKQIWRLRFSIINTAHAIIKLWGRNSPQSFQLDAKILSNRWSY